MAGPAFSKTTAAAYLAMERAAEEKHEFFDGHIYDMAGVSRQHDRIVFNLTVSLGNALKGRPCRGHTADMRVQAAEGRRYFYPDAAISCGEDRYEDDHVDTLINPVVVFEVLSPSTERYDRGRKFRAYQERESVSDIVLISQAEVSVEHFRRVEGGHWDYRAYQALSDEVPLESVGCRLSVADLYEGVQFPPPGADRDDVASKRPS